MFRLAEVAFEAQALGNLKSRDDAALDLLGPLSRSFADLPVFSAGVA
jgi:hypothetical protein